MSTDKNVSDNQQDHPHREGPMNNTTTGNPIGRKGTDNNGQSMSNMMNESEEQKAGSAHGQIDEGDVQQEQRMP